MTHPRPASRTTLSAAAVAVALAVGLAACGSSSAKTTSSPTTTTPPSSSGASGSGTTGSAGSRGTTPGAFGTVAQVLASSMEVQSQQTGQETVSWTASTRFTKTATLTAASLKAGECVTVTGTKSGTSLTARSVVITPAGATGSCTTRFGPGGRAGGAGGFGRGGFRRAGGTGSGGTPASRPNNGSVPANLGVASGSVVSVGSTSMVIHGVSFSPDFGRRAAGSTSTSTPPTTAAPTDLTIALASTTTFTETVSTTASSLAVGDCVLATGTTDSTGAVAASTVRITATAGQTCTAGFGGGFRGGGAGASGAPTNG